MQFSSTFVLKGPFGRSGESSVWRQWSLRLLWAGLMGSGLLTLAQPAALAQSAATPSRQFDWSKGPPVTPMPRLGGFLVPPSGAGY